MIKYLSFHHTEYTLFAYFPRPLLQARFEHVVEESTLIKEARNLADPRSDVNTEIKESIILDLPKGIGLMYHGPIE